MALKLVQCCHFWQQHMVIIAYLQVYLSVTLSFPYVSSHPPLSAICHLTPKLHPYTFRSQTKCIIKYIFPLSPPFPFFLLLCSPLLPSLWSAPVQSN